MTPLPTDRPAIAQRRILKILATYTIASSRTLEQKISDAGPGPLRVDPHILTPARAELVDRGIIQTITRDNAPWFYLTATPWHEVEARLSELLPIHKAINAGSLTKRIGQALEIAIYKALISQNFPGFLGSFTDLDSRDDSKLYPKQDPPQTISRRTIAPRSLDFVLGDLSAPVGVEVKNVRRWFYTTDDSLRAFLLKCCDLNAVPLLIARRIAYVTFRLLHPCGVLFHQTYNQRFPNTARALAEQAADKRLLGYHDIRVGNDPDARLLKFVRTLPDLIHPARERFVAYRDLLCDFASGARSYADFAARVRRREAGLPEDSDDDDDLADEYL